MAAKKKGGIPPQFLANVKKKQAGTAPVAKKGAVPPQFLKAKKGKGK